MIELLEKPAYGSPCNGCGQCCIAVQCPVSTALFGEKDICPALVLEKGTANKSRAASWSTPPRSFPT